MTPEQKALAKLIFKGLFLLAIFFGGFYVRGYMAEKDDLTEQVALQSRENQALSQYAFDLKTLTTTVIQLQTEAGKLESTHAAEKEKLLDENARLRDDVAVAQRMRLKGTSCPAVNTASASPSAGGVGNETEVELSAETRRWVWDLRSDLIKDNAALTYLQDYLTLYPYCSKVPITAQLK